MTLCMAQAKWDVTNFFWWRYTYIWWINKSVNQQPTRWVRKVTGQHSLCTYKWTLSFC